MSIVGADALHEFTADTIRDHNGIIVDGVLGTGITSPPRGTAQEAIQALNASKGRVVAIDLPKGLNHVTGMAPGACVQATWTLNLHMLKSGPLQSVARPYEGELYSAETGLGFATFPNLTERFQAFYRDGPIRKVPL